MTSWAVVGPAIGVVAVAAWFWSGRMSEPLRRTLIRRYLRSPVRPRRERWFGIGTGYALGWVCLFVVAYLGILVTALAMADTHAVGVLWVPVALALPVLAVGFAGLRWPTYVRPQAYRDDARRRPAEAAASIAMVGQYGGIALVTVAVLGLLLAAVQLTA